MADISTTGTTPAAAGLNSFSFGSVLNDIWDTTRNTFTSAINTAEGYYASLATLNLRQAETASNAAQQAAMAGTAPATSTTQQQSQTLLIALGIGAVALVLLARKGR